MVEERIEQIFHMVTDLIRIVGNTNAALEELREGQADLRKGQEELRGDVAVLKKDVSVLKKDVSVLKENVSVLKEDVSVLKENVSVLKKGQDDSNINLTGINLKLEQIHEDQKSIFEILGEHEVAIRNLRRRPV